MPVDGVLGGPSQRKCGATFATGCSEAPLKGEGATSYFEDLYPITTFERYQHLLSTSQAMLEHVGKKNSDVREMEELARRGKLGHAVSWPNAHGSFGPLEEGPPKKAAEKKRDPASSSGEEGGDLSGDFALSLVEEGAAKLSVASETPLESPATTAAGDKDFASPGATMTTAATPTLASANSSAAVGGGSSSSAASGKGSSMVSFNDIPASATGIRTSEGERALALLASGASDASGLASPSNASASPASSSVRTQSQPVLPSGSGPLHCGGDDEEEESGPVMRAIEKTCGIIWWPVNAMRAVWDVGAFSWGHFASDWFRLTRSSEKRPQRGSIERMYPCRRPHGVDICSSRVLRCFWDKYFRQSPS